MWRWGALALLGGLLAACGGGHDPAFEDAGSITLQVDGRAITFKKAEPWVFKPFLHPEGVHWLETAAHDPEMNTLVLYFATELQRLEQIKDHVFLGPDYAAENPERHRLDADACLNRFKADGKWYQGHKLGGTVRALADGKLTLDVDSVFLEFSYDEPEFDDQGNMKAMPPPREVQVTGSITLPVREELE